jgi:hypothetical protein
MPDIEGNHSEETRSSRCGILRTALESEDEVGTVDDDKEQSQHREKPAARGWRQDYNDDRASEEEWKTVIDDIERGKPPREQPYQGENRADSEPGPGERFYE